MFRRGALVTLVVLVALSLFAAPVLAGIQFCISDPVFNVGGHRVDVVIELAPYEVKDQIKPWNPVVTLLLAPMGTNPEVVSVSGDFPEWAWAFEWGRPHKVGIFVRVPHVQGFQQMRVTVFVDGTQVKQVVTSRRHAVIKIPWNY